MKTEGYQPKASGKQSGKPPSGGSNIKRVVELHTKNEVRAEADRMRASPEMMWWLCLVYGAWAMDGERGESILRTEAYNRLSYRFFMEPKPCPHWPDCGCGTQSGPHTCEYRALETKP